MSWILKHPKLFFLLLSVAFWIGSRFSSEGLETELEYELSYSGFSDQIQRNMPSSVSANLTGGGYSLFMEWINPFRSIKIDRIDLDESVPGWKEGLILNSLKELISYHLGENINLISIDQGNTLIEFPELIQEWWRVDDRVPLGLRKEGFFIDFPKLPDSVKVVSFSNDIFRSKMVQLRFKGPFPGIGSHRIELVPYHQSSSKVYFDADKILTEVNIDQATTVYRQVEIEPLEGRKGIINPSTVQLAFTVPLKEIQEVQLYPITVELEVSTSNDFRYPLKINIDKEFNSKLIYVSSNSVTFIPSE